MKILLSNDDGFGAAGLIALYQELRNVGHELLVVAPDRERSGASMAITLSDGVSFFKKGEALYSCSGTPVDCIFYTLLGAVDFQPDLIIGGINCGPNLGTDIIYSGTCAIARQAAMAGVLGIAVSSDRFHPPFQYEQQANLFVKQLDRLLPQIGAGCFLNINFPAVLQNEAIWVESTLSRRHYEDFLTLRHEGEAVHHCLLQGKPVSLHQEDSLSDWATVERGEIAYTFVSVS